MNGYPEVFISGTRVVCFEAAVRFDSLCCVFLNEARLEIKPTKIGNWRKNRQQGNVRLMSKLHRLFSSMNEVNRSCYVWPLCQVSRRGPRSHGLVIRVVACDARGPGFDSSSDQMIFLSSGIRR